MADFINNYLIAKFLFLHRSWFLSICIFEYGLVVYESAFLIVPVQKTIFARQQ